MIAVDTNILVYAVDSNETTRGPKAVALLESLETQPTVLLWQVVAEFGVESMSHTRSCNISGMLRRITGRGGARVN